MSTAKSYVLGTGNDELERLGLQHRLWSDAAHAAFRRARIGPGQRVLDVGCGPGYAAFDLAQMVTREGHVVAIDESAAFVDYVAEQAKSRGLPNLTAHCGDVQQLAATLGKEPPFDLAYARWVLCFVTDPAAVLRGVAAALRPGGRFLIHDYFNYGSMTVSPRSASHDRAVAATMMSWRERGGDPDIVGRLPALLDEAGFDVFHLDVHQRIARGGDSMFAWVDTWWHTFAPKLAAMGLLEARECADLLALLVRMRSDRNAFISCPPVYEVIAERRSS